MVNTGSDELDHCSKDALTGFIGWLLQGLLAGLAFTCLIGKLTTTFLLHFFFRVVEPNAYLSATCTTVLYQIMELISIAVIFSETISRAAERASVLGNMVV